MRHKCAHFLGVGINRNSELMTHCKATFGDIFCIYKGRTSWHLRQLPFAELVTSTTGIYSMFRVITIKLTHES